MSVYPVVRSIMKCNYNWKLSVMEILGEMHRGSPAAFSGKGVAETFPFHVRYLLFPLVSDWFDWLWKSCQSEVNYKVRAFVRAWDAAKMLIELNPAAAIVFCGGSTQPSAENPRNSILCHQINIYVFRTFCPGYLSPSRSRFGDLLSQCR